MIKSLGDDKTVFVSVSEVAIYFGNWSSSLENLKGKNIVVINKRNHRIVGAFKLIDTPVAVDRECVHCGGKGKISIKYDF